MTKPRTILAIDPGLNEMGYAVLRDQVLIDQNVISFAGLTQRVPAARSSLRLLIQRHRPSDLVVEQTHHYPNGLHRLMPALKQLARQKRLRFAVYSAKSVRKHLVANGWSGKAGAAQAMVLRYPKLKVYRGQKTKSKERYWFNMFDAVALATHHHLKK